MARIKLFLPLLLVVMLGALFYTMVQRIDRGEYSPESLPSALVNHPIPAFSLPTVEQQDALPVTEQQLIGEIALINVWATWCPSCHAEHSFLNTLAQSGAIKIFGVNYKDEAAAAQRWLAEKGNPYRFNLYDHDGRLGLNFGVTGAPETYLIDHRGYVRFRYQGPLNEQVWQHKFLPLIAQLRQEQGV